MNDPENIPAARMMRPAVILAIALLAAGCGPRQGSRPEIQITRVPPADPGGPQKLDILGGSVRGAQPGQQIILYAHSGIWYVQPFANQPLTKILPDGSWSNSTHLGIDYAALLVNPGYHPASRISALPEIGNGVAAIAVVKGRVVTPIVQKKLHFSGYDWLARAAGSDRGGEPNDYDPDNAWVDSSGYLHLRMANRNGKWACAEVNLTRSLGYGTYRFVIQDSARLNPSAVVGFYTWDDLHSEDFRNELDIELSRWGNPKNKDAQYVVQPFYVAENLFRFEAPPGVVTHTFRWEPGKATFKSFPGQNGGAEARPVGEHVFTSGIPAPASETVHMNLYEFHHSRNPSQQPSEVVIEKFEYLP